MTTKSNEELTYELWRKGWAPKQIAIFLGKPTSFVYRWLSINKSRRTSLGVYIDGKLTILTGLKKRDYTGWCELCGKTPAPGKKLSYHHWLDCMPHIGLWLCYRCHMAAECIDDDSGISVKYIKAKVRVSKECIDIDTAYVPDFLRGK